MLHFSPSFIVCMLIITQLNAGALFKWNIGLIVVNPDSAFNGGYYKVIMPLLIIATYADIQS